MTRPVLLLALVSSLVSCEKAPAPEPSPTRETHSMPEPPAPTGKWWCFHVQKPVIPLGACLETKAECETRLRELLQLAPSVVSPGCQHQAEVACAEGGRVGSTWTKCVGSMDLCKAMYSESTKERPIVKACALAR